MRKIKRKGITKNQILNMLDGNWDLTNRGTIEKLEADIDLLKDALSTCLFLLQKKKILSAKDIISRFKEGWKITYEK